MSISEYLKTKHLMCIEDVHALCEEVCELTVIPMSYPIGSTVKNINSMRNDGKGLGRCL